MRVFVTGATGFVGTIVVAELLAAGHEVLGLARSDASARALVQAGVGVHRGSVEDVDSLKAGAEVADGVIHLAFNHDFSRFRENCESDHRAIEAMGEALAESGRPLVVTSGSGITPGDVVTEDAVPSVDASVIPRFAPEKAVDALTAHGVRATVVRLPQVHDRDRQGLISYAKEIAQEKGVSVYVGDGRNRWPAEHRFDVAPLYRLALEKGNAGARYHAVAEGGVALKDIAEAIGRRLDVTVANLSPTETGAHFGWLAAFMALDLPASSILTQAWLDWVPKQSAGLIADIDLSS